jgi:F0F1-type ATP synthase membrane subunit c/vacuolar-type H+-ATPase subunit K
LITAPLALVFVLLLSRADPVFASVFRLPKIDAERVVEHVVLTGAFAWWSAGYLRGALLGVSRRPALPERMPVHLGLAEITTSFGVVIALFTLFVVLQLRWLFGGADVVLATTGLTIAEYARRGFFELVAVTALVLPLILATRAFIEDERVVRRHRQLSIALIILVLAIMASAMLRMKLYVGYFGLSTDRFYATAVMVWLGLVSLAMARTVLRGWSRPFAAMTMVSGFLTLFLLNAINPDQLVARVNLGRSSLEHGIDYVYLARLSGDAAPMVVQAVKTATPAVTSCAAAKSLRAKWPILENASWNLGARRGRDAVRANLSAADELRLCAGVPEATGAPLPAVR